MLILIYSKGRSDSVEEAIAAKEWEQGGKLAKTVGQATKVFCWNLRLKIKNY